MNTARIKKLVIQKGGGIAWISAEEMKYIKPFLENENLKQYLNECVPLKSFEASGVYVLSKDDI